MKPIHFRRRISTAAVLVCAALYAADGGDRQAYVMISGWGLYPEPNSTTDRASSTLRTALAAIAKNHISGIIYGTLGVPPRIREKAGLRDDFDPNAYNEAVFALAKERKANLWMQLRYYDDWVSAGGAPPAHLTAPQILSDASAEKAFTQSAMAAIRAYAKAYPDACTVILGEEETIYHSKDGGGLFWTGQKVWDQSTKLSGGQYLEHSEALDQVFVTNFTGIHQLLIRLIKSEFPGCRVGIHIGHAPLYQKIGDEPVYAVILQKLRPLHPDFTFYDLYSKVSRNGAEFRAKLSDRVRLLKGLGQPVYYLAQLHTTNNFGAGGGRTPSAGQLDETFDLAKRLGVEGFGYYAKNAVPTICTGAKAVAAAGCSATEDMDPLDPNVTAQNMVWESSPRRWEYGLSKLRDFLAPGR